MVCCLRGDFPLSVAVFRKVFQCYNSSSGNCGWVYIKQRPKCKHIFNSAFIPYLLADLQINPCQLPPNAWRNILCFMFCCLREGFPLSVAVFRKVFQCYNSSSSNCGWVYVKQRPKCKHIFNSASIPDNNQNWRNSFVGLRWENGDWGTLFRSSFGKVSDGSLKSIPFSFLLSFIHY